MERRHIFRTFLLRHADFFRNVAVLMSGRSIAAVIGLAAVPIVSRLFTPSDFGVAAVFASTVIMLSEVATLRYGSAIILPKSESTAIQLLGFSHRVAMVYCLLLFVTVLAFDLTGVTWANLEMLGIWKWLIPVGVWLVALIGIQETWLTRVKGFGVISTSLLTGSITASSVRIGAGTLFGTSVGGLILGELCGNLARLLVPGMNCKLGMSAALSRQPWHIFKSLATRFSDFPLFNAPAGLVFSIGQNLPVLLFGTMFSPAIAGFYAMANRVSQVPISILAASMRRVFMQKAAEIANTNRSLMKAFLLSEAMLALIGFIPFGAVYLFGQVILTWLLGSDWRVAGTYLEIMAPWLFMVWIMVPCNSIFIVLRKQKFWLALTSFLTTLRLGAFGIAHIMGSEPTATLQLFVIATIFGNFITIMTTFSLIRSAASSDRS